MSVLDASQYAVYLILDNPSRYVGDFLENIDKACSGGVTLVQYRDKESDGRRLYERCKRVRELLRARGIPLCVNNLPGLALAVDAEAVHVGQDDMPPEAVRHAVGRRMDIGESVRTLEEARMVDRAVVDAVGIGPVYDARGTKEDAADALGLDGLRSIVEVCADLATVAIGGVNVERAEGIYRTGVGGVSAVSAFSKSMDPASVARAFVAARERALSGR